MPGIKAVLLSAYRATRLARKLAKICVIVLVCAAVLFFLARGALYVIYGIKLKAEIKRFEAIGGSIDVARLVKPVIPREDGNTSYLLEAAGLVYREARPEQPATKDLPDVDLKDPNAPYARKLAQVMRDFGAWRGFSTYRTLSQDVKPQNRPRMLDWNPDWLPYLRQYLEGSSIPLTLAKEGAAGAGSFDVDWSQGYKARLPHLSGLRHIARLLFMDSAVAAADGDMRGAYEDVRLILRLRRFIDDDPMLVSKLVAFALDSMADSALAGCLERAAPDRDTFRTLMKELDGREEANDVSHAFIGETAIDFQTFEAVRHDPASLGVMGGNVADTSLYPRSLLKFTWIAPADEYDLLRIMRIQIEAARRPFPESLDEPEEVKELLYRGQPFPFPFALNYFSRMFTAALSRVAEQAAKRDAYVGLARAALALSVYKTDTGRYPDALEALVPGYLPKIDTDPFDGKPLKYKLRGDGFVVYSAGPNKIDDGGVWKIDGGDMAADITWEMEK